MPALNRELAAIQVVTRLADDVLDRVGAGQEVGQEPSWLDVFKDVLGRRPRLEHQDAQRWVRCRQPLKNYPSGRATCIRIRGHEVRLEGSSTLGHTTSDDDVILVEEL